jgi:acetyltransferase
LHKLDVFLPKFWSRGNPIDILGDASPERVGKVLEVCFEAREIDAVLVILTPQAMTEPMSVANVMVSTIEEHRFPVFICLMGGKSIGGAVNTLNEAGVPTYETPERAVRALMYMYDYSRNLEMLHEIPPKVSKHIKYNRESVRKLISHATDQEFMSESDSKEILGAYGLPVIRTETAETDKEATEIGEEIGYPLVMKLHSPDITHKTEAGGIRLDLRSKADVGNAFRNVIDSARKFKPDARINGVTIQPFYSNPDFEILLGAKQDPNFGPVILFGMGGIYTEVLKDRALGLPPMNRLLASRLIQETKAFRLLKGYRNRQPADLEQLEEMIIRLSQLLVDCPDISELDMNPVLIKDGKAVAVDARILIYKTGVPSPKHLVISPYPEELESHETVKGNIRIFIRPVKPEDAPLFTDLFKILSPTSIYYRFFAPIKALKPEMLARFTQIDYDREIAMVAIQENENQEKLLGVARIIGDSDGKQGEFAVVVGDPWHGIGIGAVLLQKCLDIAKKRGYESIMGCVLRENKNMLALGKKLGFRIEKHPDVGECELTLQF